MDPLNTEFVEEPIGSMGTASEIENDDEFLAYVQGSKPENVRYHLNIFLQDAQHESSLFTEEEWQTFHDMVGREKIMDFCYIHRAGLTRAQIDDLKGIFQGFKKEVIDNARASGL